jgi:hypothetical protein
MNRIATGVLIDIDLIGRGRVIGQVIDATPFSYHGIPDFASRVRVRLDDGVVFEGMSLHGAVPWFADPRVRVIGIVQDPARAA